MLQMDDEFDTSFTALDEPEVNAGGHVLIPAMKISSENRARRTEPFCADIQAARSGRDHSESAGPASTISATYFPDRHLTAHHTQTAQASR
jgi:hypothetical protein